MKLRIVTGSKIPEETDGICVVKLKIRFARRVQAKNCSGRQACILEITHILPSRDRQAPSLSRLLLPC